jgi:hypothetical protein
MCLYVCDQETPKREAKGPSWTITACVKDVRFGGYHSWNAIILMNWCVERVVSFIRMSMLIPHGIMGHKMH